MSEDFLFVVGGAKLGQGGSDDASRQSKQSAQLGCRLARGSWTCRNVYQDCTNPILMKKGSGTFFCLSEVLRCVYARTQENGKIPLYRGVLSWGGVWYTRLSSTNRELYVEEDYYEYS